jgi:hypothetical protein
MHGWLNVEDDALFDWTGANGAVATFNWMQMPLLKTALPEGCGSALWSAPDRCGSRQHPL